MRPHSVWPGLLALTILIAACAPVPQIRNEKFLSDHSLLTGDPCTAPCWMGITPGQTNWRDALTIVEDSERFTDMEIRNIDDSEGRQAVWAGADGDVCCVMVSDDGLTVSRVFLQLAPEFSMDALLDVRGDPEFAVGSEVAADQAIINLIYPDSSTVVYAFVAGAEAGELAPSSEIVGALYITPDDMDLLMQTTNLHVWEGYQSYRVYTPDEDVAVFEVTPRVTLTPTPDN